MTENIKPALEIFEKMNQLEIIIVLFELLKSGKLNYVELSKVYAEHLEEMNRKDRHSIATLSLMLSYYAANDQSAQGKNCRKHIYESGAFTGGDGSIFGEKLHEEFKDQLK